MQMTSRSLTTGRTLTLGLLAALLLLAALVVPAYADDDEFPPEIWPLFAGTVIVLQRGEPVPEGTLVEAFVDGVKQQEATVATGGRYQLLVPGRTRPQDQVITFKVAGVLANETRIWRQGEENLNFNLTVARLPSDSRFPFPVPCFIATAAYGTDTAEEINILREFRDAVLMPSRAGATLVWLYYRVSPSIAEVIALHDSLRTAVRSGFIGPLVAMLNWSSDIWAESER